MAYIRLAVAGYFDLYLPGAALPGLLGIVVPAVVRLLVLCRIFPDHFPTRCPERPVWLPLSASSRIHGRRSRIPQLFAFSLLFSPAIIKTSIVASILPDNGGLHEISARTPVLRVVLIK